MASSKIIRRKARRLPSVRKHGFSAILLLSLIVLSTYAWLQFAGKRVNQANIDGPEFELDKPDNLNTAGGTDMLPDLLNDDNIPQDVNPTETMSLLGGPKSSSNQPRPPATTISTPQNQPKTILIDGAPIEDSEIVNNISQPLTKAPIQGLTRMTPFGLVPSPAQNGRTALGSYAKPFTPVTGNRYISIVVGGLGLNPALTQRAINELPGEVSLSFAAQSPNLQNWVDRARAKGHEVLIELPMQNDTIIDTDQHLLKANVPHSENIRNLDYLLSRVQGYFAVTNYGGENLLKNTNSLKPVLDHIHNAGLGFIYDNSFAGNIITATAKEANLPFISAKSMIDETANDKNSVRQQITALPVTGDQISLGMGFSYAGTIDGILDWLNTNNKAVHLAPASYALKGK